MARTQHVKYLVMAMNYWGIGDTEDEAAEFMMDAGGTIVEGYMLLDFPETTIFQSVHPVYGEITFTYDDGTEAPPAKRQVAPVEALTKRKQWLHRCMVNDDIDADIREDIREEQHQIDEILASL